MATFVEASFGMMTDSYELQEMVQGKACDREHVLGANASLQN